MDLDAFSFAFTFAFSFAFSFALSVALSVALRFETFTAWSTGILVSVRHGLVLLWDLRHRVFLVLLGVRHGLVSLLIPAQSLMTVSSQDIRPEIWGETSMMCLADLSNMSW